MKRSAWRYLWSAHDIRRKLLITLLILAIYRLASHIPVPGANKDVMAQILSAGGATGNLINILDLLSGGTVSPLLRFGHGRLPIHYRPNHPAATHAYHPLLAEKNGGRSSRGSEVARKVDLLPCSAHGCITSHWPGEYF